MKYRISANEFFGCFLTDFGFGGIVDCVPDFNVTLLLRVVLSSSSPHEDVLFVTLDEKLGDASVIEGDIADPRGVFESCRVFNVATVG